MQKHSITDGCFHKTVLHNGIRVISEQIPGVQSVALGIWIIAGSRFENRQNNGISHFIEHMVFKGTRNRSAFEIAKSLESVGGSLNAFTSKESTCYIAQILDRNLPLAIEVIADLIQNPSFSPDDIEKEKNVVFDEISSVEETPEELVHEYFQGVVFSKHPLGYSVLGSREIVSLFSQSMLKQFWKEYYTGNRIIVTAAGNVEHDIVVRHTHKFFSRSSPENKKHRTHKIGPLLREKIVQQRIQQTHVCIGGLGLSYRTPKKYPLMLLSTVLGGGMSSRLFQNIREKYGIAYSIYSFSEFLSDFGIFGVYLSTDREKITQSLRLIRKEFRNVRDKRIRPQELNNVKNQLIGNLTIGMESPSSRMSRIAKMEMHLGNYISLDKVINCINGVTADQIRDVAIEILPENSLQTTMLVPTA